VKTIQSESAGEYSLRTKSFAPSARVRRQNHAAAGLVTNAASNCIDDHSCKGITLPTRLTSNGSTIVSMM
jgi:hypothetical protein